MSSDKSTRNLSQQELDNSNNNSKKENQQQHDKEYDKKEMKIGQKEFIMEKPIETVFSERFKQLSPDQQERLKMVNPQHAMMLFFATNTFLASLVTQPFSRVETILRTQHVLPKAYGVGFYTSSSSALSEMATTGLESMMKSNNNTVYESIAATSQNQAPFKGAIDVFNRLPKDRTLWRGLAPNVYGRICSKVVQLQFADEVKNFVQPWIGNQALVEQDPNDPTKRLLHTKMLATAIMSGSLAGVVAYLISYPFSVVSTRMQANLIPLNEVKYNLDWKMLNKNNFSNVWQSFKSIAQFEGLRGFYSGISATIPAIAISRGIQFALFDTIMSIAKSENLSASEKLLLGQSTLLASLVASYPFRVIGDRLRVQAVFRKLYSEEESQLFYRGTLDAMKKIYQQEGFRGYYRGFLYFTGVTYAGGFLMTMLVLLGWRQF